MIIEKIRLHFFMNISGYIAACVILLSTESFADTDTTTGETRLLPKVTEKNEDNQTGSKKKDHRSWYRNDKDEEESCLWSFFSEIFTFIFIEPVKTFFNTDLVTDNFSEKKVKFGFGASILDFALYPNTSFSYSIKLSGDFLFIPNEFISIREHFGIHLSPLGGFLSDFERDVYVNGGIIGAEKDKGDHYFNFSFPVSTELMLKPADGSLFFIIGAGPRYVYERFEGTRRYSYQDSKDSISLSDGNWIPTMSFGIGKLFDIGGPFVSFEIRYSLGINTFRKENSLPGDNTRFVHGLTAMHYQIFF